MSISIQNFVVLQNDEIKKISTAMFNKVYLKGLPDHKLAPFIDKKLRMVELVVELENKKPVAVIRESYRYIFVVKGGTIDVNKSLTDAMNYLDVAVDIPVPSPEYAGEHKVIDSRDKFEKRRLENEYVWVPTPSLRRQIIQVAMGEKSVMRF